MSKMTWACGLILVLLFPQFPSIREINFNRTFELDIENELLPKNLGKRCGEDDAVNLNNLDLSNVPTHVIKSDKIRHVDLSYNKISNIPDSFFLDVPNIECLNLTANHYAPKDVLDGRKSYSLKTLVLDRTRPIDDAYGNTTSDSFYNTYDNGNRYENDNRCTMTGYFPNLETLHLSYTESCYMDASVETKLPRLATLYLLDYGTIIGLHSWQLPSTLRHLHLEGTRLDQIPLNVVDNLESLYLDRYNYEEDFNLSYDIVNLQVLSCRGCSLNTAAVRSFFHRSRNALRRLDLSHNVLHDLPDCIFMQASNLESLLLSNNMFSIIPDMRPLSRLRALVLNHNTIKEVADRKSDSLVMLSLRGNGISRINASTFEGFPALEMLDLSQNKLASLPLGWTHGLKNLVTLNLESNSFVRFSDTSLTTVNSDLRHLLMHANPIERFDEQDFKLFPDNCTIHFML